MLRKRKYAGYSGGKKGNINGFCMDPAIFLADKDFKATIINMFK